MSTQRGDTRERIQRVALELFAENGYENTALREVAEQLGITRPALYYHFKTKEDILAGILGDLVGSLDELIDWARRRPATAEARRETLTEIAELFSTRLRPLLRFAQTNQPALQHHDQGEQLRQRFLALMSLLVPADADVTGQLEARLAVVALLISHAPAFLDVDVPQDELTAASIEVATRLVDRHY